MILAIRLRGVCGVKKEIADTMRILGLEKRYSGALIAENESTKGMIKKIVSFVAWGEASPETMSALKAAGKIKEQTGSFGLKPPVGGLTNIKQAWPNGDLGYRGTEINDLVKRMM